MNLIQEACKYAQKGWKVFPLSPGGKNPIHSGGFHNATDDLEQIIDWWTQYPNANIGVATGSMSDIWVLDVDIKKQDGVATIKKLIEKYGTPSKTLIQKTASGGWHYIYKHQNGLGSNAARLTGIDVRADGGYIVVAPSILANIKDKHAAGSYHWVNDLEPVNIPKWLIDEIYNSKKNKSKGSPREGGRNEWLFGKACAHRGKGHEYPELLNLLLEDNLNCIPPLNQKEVETIAQSAMRYEPEELEIDIDSEEILKMVNPLGIHEGNYVFYSQNNMCVQYLSPTYLGKRENLESLVSYKLLLKYFPHEKGYNKDIARRFLMDQCRSKGIYKPKNLAGIGIWKDNNDKDLVINTGNSLVVNGIPISYDDYKTKITYANHDEKIIDLDLSLSDNEIKIITKAITKFVWKEDYYGYLTLGAIIQAVISGALRWRSHLWIIAPAGSGKSTIQSSTIQKLLGILCSTFAGAQCTEAGIRQSVGENGYAVCIDDIDDKDHLEKIQQVILLARACSSDKNDIVKGSASGRAVRYRCQSPFIISSIKTYLKDKADLDRFNIVTLKSQRECSQEESEQFFTNQGFIEGYINEELSHKFIAHVMNNAANIIDLIQKMKQELRDKGIKDMRMVDQWAGLLGPARLFVDFDLGFVNQLIEDQKNTFSFGEDEEAAEAFEKLINTEITMPYEHGQERMTIKQALSKYNETLGNTNNFLASNINLKDKLLSYGFKIMEKNGKRLVAMSVKNNFLSSILGPSWGALLSRLSFVEYNKGSVSFGGRTSVSPAYTFLISQVIVDLDDLEEDPFI